jgi:protein TonB
VSGWAELQFLVTKDGAITNVVVTGAQPAGVFEQAAVEAVKKWRYKPVRQAGQAVDQPAYVRVRFTLQQ